MKTAFRLLVFGLLMFPVLVKPPIAQADIPLSDQVQILNNKGAALAKQEKYEAAIGQYRKALAVSPENGATENPLLITAKAEGLFGIGEAQRNSGKLDQALITYNEILKMYPRNRHICAEASMGIAKVYQKKED